MYMQRDELDRWFAANQVLLEAAYLAGEMPWQQSGFGLHTPHTEKQWTAQRRPIADAIDRAGSFLALGARTDTCSSACCAGRPSEA
jgi:hypothetical protein